MQIQSSDDDFKRIRKQAIDNGWLEFCTRFPTEHDCLEEIYRKLYANGISCTCGSEEITHTYGSRTFFCRRCKLTTWLLADSFFSNIRKARPWLGRIWLMEKRIPINSFEFHHLAGIASSTALEIFKRLSLVLDSVMIGESVVHSEELISLICKRSRETPRREHPRAELENLDNLDDDLPQSELDSDSLKVLDSLEFDRQIPFDSILARSGLSIGKVSAALVLLELDGFVKRMFGDNYLRLKRSSSKRESLRSGSLPDFVVFVRMNFRGVSRRNLQFYLATYWCFKTGVSNLLTLCIKFGKMSTKEIRQYVSPAYLKVA